MKVYLDDERQTPEGWTRTYNVPETIGLLQIERVTHLSLDNDLGEGEPEGHNVLTWLEQQVFYDPSFQMPIVSIHSANPVRVEYMKRVLLSIERIRQQQVGGGE